MKKENQQKVKKHLQKNVALVAGLIGSLGVLSVGVIGGWKTFRQDPIAPHIEFIEEEIKPASRNLKRNLERDFERYLKLDFERDLELDFELYFERDFELYLELDFELYFKRNLELYFERNLERNFERNFERDFERDFERYLKLDFERDFELYFGRIFEVYFGRDFGNNSRNFGRNFELYFGNNSRNFERDFEIRFFKKMVRIKFYVLLLRIIPRIYYRNLLSELLLKELNQIIEMSQKFGLTENQEFLTIEEKQSKLIQFSLITTLSVVGFTSFFLLLIEHRKQNINWSMTGMYLLPEECVAAMETLYQILQDGEEPTWKIRLIMLWNIAVLLKNFYIQVKVEDLFIPNKKYK